MHVLFFLARVYPYWAFSLAIVLVELGMFFKRRGSKWRFHSFGAAVLLLGGIVAWLAFRGDIHSDQWMRNALSAFSALKLR